MMTTNDGKSRVRDDPCQSAAGWLPTGTDLSQLSHELGRTTPDSGVNAGQPVDHDLRIWTPAHWPDTLGESPVLTPQGGLFTGTLASGNHTRRLADRSWSCARRVPRAWTGPA